MKAIHKKRLLNVAKALIDEARWRKRNPPRGSEDKFCMKRFVNACGSPACALGTYAHRRDLQRAFKIGEAGMAFPRPWVTTAGGVAIYIADPSRSEGPVMEHFGLTLRETVKLFGERGCGRAKTEHEAAAYIRAFVKRKEREARNA